MIKKITKKKIKENKGYSMEQLLSLTELSSIPFPFEVGILSLFFSLL